MNWCFAIINGKLAETFFEKRRGKINFLGHCYVKLEEYKTKHEQKMIKQDTEKFQFTYRNKQYKDLIDWEELTVNP